jgi:hypothetical protein
MIKNKQTKKPFIIEDLSDIVSWVYIQEHLSTPDYRRFLKWMEGQTVTENGVYQWDFERFLLGRNPFRY